MKRFIEHNMKRFVKHTFQPATKRNLALSAIELGVIVQGGFPKIITGLSIAIAGFSVIFAAGVLVAFGLFPLSIFIAPIAIGLFIAAVGACVSAYGIRLGTKVAIARKSEITELVDKWVPLQDDKHLDETNKGSRKDYNDASGYYAYGDYIKARVAKQMGIEAKDMELDDETYDFYMNEFGLGKHCKKESFNPDEQGSSSNKNNQDESKKDENVEGLERAQQESVVTEDDEYTKFEAEVRKAVAEADAEGRKALAEANPHLSPDEINSAIELLKQLGEAKTEEEAKDIMERMLGFTEKNDTRINTEEESNEALGIPEHRPLFKDSDLNTAKEQCVKKSDDLKDDQSTVTMKQC